MRLEKDEWGKRGRSGEEEDGLKSEREEERRGAVRRVLVATKR